jgi:hypothetical protein
VLDTPTFPTPVVFGGRLRFDEYDFESYKRRLAGLPIADRDPNAPVRFKNAHEVCADLGINRRTLGRRLRGRAQNG